MRALLAFTALLALAASTSLSSVAHADQRREYMLASTEPGDRLIFDYFGIGSQLTLEHRRGFFQNANDYTLSTSALLSYPMGQVSATAALRFLYFELSVTAGYRAVWRNLSFEPGDDGSYCKDCDRVARRNRDPILGYGPDTDHFPYGEARVQVYAPFNEYFIMTSLLAANYQGLRTRSFDWVLTDIHDPGVIARWELMAFVKHRKWGGIGPYFQLQSLPRGDHHESEFTYGFNAVSRLGIIARNDMLFLSVLLKPNDPYFGQHSFYSPMRALITWRLILSL